MKNDQVRECTKCDPRHVYANPFNSIVCPVLSLTIYLSVFSISGTKDSSLFPGTHQYKRFSKYFKMILKKHTSEIQTEFGVDVKDIVMHSLCKDAPSYVSSGSTCTPTLPMLPLTFVQVKQWELSEITISDLKL